MNKQYKFSDDFVFGVATSAGQIEGAILEDGRKLSSWDAFSFVPGNVANGETAAVACDSYHRYKDDVALFKELGVFSYRFSTSWSRILPDGVGTVNHKGFDYYKKHVDLLLENGIMPNITLNEKEVKGIVEDIKRMEYVKAFLREIARANEGGLDIKGYYLWSLLDNFEWDDGYSMKYGICKVDFKTQERTMKRSALEYKRIIKDRMIID